MKALLIVDLQNDFLPGGPLAVPEGDRIVPIVNELMPAYDLVVATQDWHPAEHVSFYSNHSKIMRNVFNFCTIAWGATSASPRFIKAPHNRRIGGRTC